MKKKEIITSNIIIGIILILLSIFVFVYGGANFPEASGVDTGTKFFPFILAGIMIALSVILIIQAFIPNSQRSAGFSFKIFSPEMMRVAVAVVCCIFFMTFLKPLGFIIVAFITLYIMMLVLGNKHYFIMAVVSLITVIVIQLFFEKILSVMLPYGILTNLLY